MKSENTIKFVTFAAWKAGEAVQALHDALPDANALQGDCIGDLIREAEELKRKCARLAEVIEQDSKP